MRKFTALLGFSLLLAGCEPAPAGPTTAPPPPPQRGGPNPGPAIVIPAAAALSPDNKRALVGYAEQVSNIIKDPPGGKVVKLWDMETGKLLRTLEGHDGSLCFVAFLPDGNAISAGGTTVKRWDLKTGKQVWSSSAYNFRVKQAALSPDGQRLLTWGWDGPPAALVLKLKLLDVRNGKLLRAHSGYQALDVWKLAFAPKSGLAFVGFVRANQPGVAIELLDVDTGKVVKSFPKEQGWKYPLAFSPDGKLVLSHRRPPQIGARGRLVLWDLVSGREARAFGLRREERDAGSPAWPVAAAFTENARQVLTADSDGVLRTWGTDGKELRAAPLDPPWAGVNTFSADARRLLRASGAQNWGAGIRLTLWDTTDGKELLIIKE
jgi:WD40 repeat protein